MDTQNRDMLGWDMVGCDMLGWDMLGWDMLACVGAKVRGHAAVLGRGLCSPPAQPSSGRIMLPRLCWA